jgi:uncharacterized membrane protein
MSVRFASAALFALAAAVLGCHKTGVDCTPPPQPLQVSEAGCPSFTNDVLPNVFVPVCENCHAPGQQEAVMPLTNYQQIYGPATGPNMGAEAREIFNQVFESCLMPPSNAPEPLTAGARQTLLDWFACGALDDAPPADAAVGN